MKDIETVYEVVFDRCGTATTKRATVISRNAKSRYAEREVPIEERRRQTEDRRSSGMHTQDIHSVHSHHIKMDLRSSKGRRKSDHVRNTFFVIA